MKLLSGSIIISILSLFYHNGFAQVGVVGGLNYCNVRNDNVLKNTKSIFTYQMGVTFNFYPFKSFSDLSIKNEFLFTEKGYKQELNKTYTFHFDYLSYSLLANYHLSENFSIEAGGYISELINTNVKQGLKTYNTTDAGLVLGLTFLERKTVSLNSKINYGLIPMLNYYNIDNRGNFTGEINDLKNICFSLGISLNVYNEKIQFYK